MKREPAKQTQQLMVLSSPTTHPHRPGWCRPDSNLTWRSCVHTTTHQTQMFSLAPPPPPPHPPQMGPRQQQAQADCIFEQGPKQFFCLSVSMPPTSHTTSPPPTPFHSLVSAAGSVCVLLGCATTGELLLWLVWVYSLPLISAELEFRSSFTRSCFHDKQDMIHNIHSWLLATSACRLIWFKADEE